MPFRDPSDPLLAAVAASMAAIACVPHPSTDVACIGDTVTDTREITLYTSAGASQVP